MTPEFIPLSQQWPIGHNDFGGPSRRLLVCMYEFGFAPTIAVARCFLSSLHPDDLRWYLDQDFYNLDGPYQIPSSVYFWAEMPDIPTYEQCEAIRKNEMQLSLFEGAK